MIDIEKVKKFNELLISKSISLVCAESITAGLLASTIASISGASAVLKGSIVTYDENLKMVLLGVDPLVLIEHSAESQETTNAMCLGLKKLYPEASIHLAITGVASKPKDDNYKVNKNVGQIYVSILYDKHFYKFETIIKGDFKDERNSIRKRAVEFIMNKIIEII